MNPSYAAMQKALLQMSINIMMGIHGSPKRETLTPSGRTPREPELQAFPKSDIVELSEEEKERKVRAYLDNLAKEAKKRAEAHAALRTFTHPEPKE
jgi:hypothetical protein